MAIALIHILDILANPSDAFTSLKQQPRWFIAFIVIGSFTILIAFLLHPFSQHLMHSLLSVQYEDHEIERILNTAQRFTYIGYIFNPVILLLRWLIVAALLYFIAVLLNAENLTYKSIYASVVYAEIVFVVMGILNVIVLYFKGVDTVTHPIHLQAIAGMDILMRNPTDNMPLFIFLNNINIFSVWYLVILKIGLSIMTRFSKLKSALIVTFVWLLTVIYQVVIATISEKPFFSIG